jgi:hypothetical protein
MEDMAARVASLKLRVDTAERARAGAEYARQEAEKLLASATAALQQEFGAGTLEQAKALLDDFDRKIAAEVEKIEQALAQ